MQKVQYKFSAKTTTCYFDADLSHLEKLVDKSQAVIVTDENIFRTNPKRFGGWNTIVIRSGEEFKIQATVDSILEQLIAFGADRSTFLIGVGGGVVTDIAGFAASVYMRGISFGFAPTSILAMVDASIGGKNGIDIGVYKNLAGTIRQPDFLLYDFSLLKSLPKAEWINGFAEIIKHACIKDAVLFRELEKNKLGFYQKDKAALAKLIRKNVAIKSLVVQKDEFEKGDRRLLNFGHTLGHAIENLYELSHGQAISIGMTGASMISEEYTKFTDTGRVISVLKKYGLPTEAEFDAKKVLNVLKMDKKKEKEAINYVLLNKIGQGVVRKIPIVELDKLLQSILAARGSSSARTNI
ncbi:MAG TPA: 3-dehydroquinate synthase [Puia sp.]|nr:3-dehydroquinate synthase [Puia sp.]